MDPVGCKSAVVRFINIFGIDVFWSLYFVSVCFMSILHPFSEPTMSLSSQ